MKSKKLDLSTLPDRIFLRSPIYEDLFITKGKLYEATFPENLVYYIQPDGDCPQIRTFVDRPSVWLNYKHCWEILIPIRRQDFITLIENTPVSAFVTLKFLKKDGTERTLNGRRNVKKAYSDPNHPKKPTVDTDKFWIFYDLKIKEYRAVNKHTVYEASVNKTKYVVED